MTAETAAAATCNHGWSNDLYHTASKECAVPTGVLEVLLIVGAVLSAVAFVNFSITVVKVRRSGEAWSSPRTVGYVAFAMGALGMSASNALLVSDTQAGLEDLSASWRILFLASLVLTFAVGMLVACWVLIEPSVHFVASLDASMARSMRRAIARGWAALAVAVACAMAGNGMGLLGTTEGVNDAGVALALAGIGACAGGSGAVLIHIARRLADLIAEVGEDTASGRQLANLRKAMLAAGNAGVQHVPPFIIIAAVPQLRGLGGVLLCPITAALVAPAVAIALHIYEHKRIAPNKVVPTADSHAAPTNIKTHIAHAQVVLARDKQRLKEVLAQEASPEGLVLNGVTLSFLKRFADEYAITPDMTAEAVCKTHIKMITSKAKTSVVALLDDGCEEGASQWVGKPNFFVSYAWSYSFCLLIDILEQYELEHPAAACGTNYYFLDQFSLNQHDFVYGTPAFTPRALETTHTPRPELPSAAAQAKISDALRAQMLKSGHVLMCQHPWNQPVPLQRAWCLFEAFVARDNGIPLSMAFGQDDAAALHAAASDGSYNAAEAVGEIRAQDALATKDADKQLILGIVENSIGLEQFNKDVQDNLLKAMRGTVTALVAQAHARTRKQTSLKLRKSAEAKGKQQAVPEQVQLQF